MRDSLSVVANNQDISSQGVGTVLSESSYDAGAAGTPPAAFQAVGSIVKDMGRGKQIFVECRVTTACTSTNSTATVQAQVVMADDAALTSSLVLLEQTDAILVTALVAGYRWRLGSVPAGVTKRYLGLRLAVAVEALTAGVFWGEFSLSKIDLPVTS